MNRRLHRARDERMIAGVAGGLARYLEIDPSIVRVLWAVLVVLTGGLMLLLYIIMAIVVPEEPWGEQPGAWGPTGWGPPPGWGGPPGWGPPPGTPPPTGGTEAPGAPGAVPPGTMPPPAESVPPAAAAGAASGWGSAWRALEGWDPEQAWKAARPAHRGDGTGALVFGLILILAGGYALIRLAAPTVDVDRYWPVAVIAVGALLMVGSFIRR